MAKRKRAQGNPDAAPAKPPRPKPEPDPQPKSWRAWAFVALVITLGSIIYYPSLYGPFILDDYDMLETASAVRAGELGPLIRSRRPLLLYTFHLNILTSGGFNSFHIHATNVALHILNALLLWGWLRRLFTPGRIEGAVDKYRPLFIYGLPLFFLTSPIMTESVAYISSRSELLATTFYILGLWGFTAFRGSRPWMTAAVVIVCFVGAATSKQDKLTLPVVVILLDYLILSKCDWRGLLESWRVYGLLVIGGAAGFFVLVVPILYQPTVGFGLDWQQYAFTQLRMYFRYIRQLIVPLGLNVDPSIQPSNSLMDHFSWLALIGLLLIATGTIYIHRKAPLAAFGIAFFFVCLAPTTAIIPMADFAAERRLYLPAIGFLLFLLRLATLAFEPGSRVAYAVVGTIITLYSFGTYQRSLVWSNEVNLWQDTVTKSPDKDRPWTWLGRVYEERDMIPEATLAWLKAESVVEKNTDQHSYVLLNLGLASARAKDYKQALRYYRRAIAINDGDPRFFAFLGVALMRDGQASEGWRAFARATSFKNALQQPEVYLLYGQELYQAERYEEAVLVLQYAVDMRPDDLNARKNLDAAKIMLERQRAKERMAREE